MMQKQIETVMPLYDVQAREGKAVQSEEETIRRVTLADVDEQERTENGGAAGDGEYFEKSHGGENGEGYIGGYGKDRGESYTEGKYDGENGIGDVQSDRTLTGQPAAGQTTTGQIGQGQTTAGQTMTGQTMTGQFVPSERKQELDLGAYAVYEELVKTFYTIDSNTVADAVRLNVEKLSQRDLRMEAEGDGPQILIYHTHSQETYADSVPGDPSTSVVGVGEHLAQLLREEYGYQVIHCTEQFDVENRNQAYNKALPVLQQILNANPSIQVMIDLHRDEMPVGTRLVTEIDGITMARFMFFNGLSRTKSTGNISYLKNENLDGNLAFSFQMQLKCAEYYPGLTRKIYLKGYRYNLHLRERSLLVEMGAQNNTVEEAMNACGPLAHALYLVLSGE